MQKLIRIFSLKKISVERTNMVHDILKTVDVAYAEIDETTKKAKIFGGKYNGKYLDKLDENFSHHDFMYQELDERSLHIGKSFKNELQFLDYAIDTFINNYYYIHKLSDSIDIKPCQDKEVIEIFERGLNPSLADSLGDLINQMQESRENSFTIPSNLINQLVGRTDSLEQQDANQFKTNIKDYNIKEKYEELKDIVIGQDKQLKIILANLIKNISLSYSNLSDQKIKNLKSRIFIIGGTGTGKTLMVENIASMLDVPYIIEDAKRYTSNGYVGEDVENMLLNLYNAAGEDLEKFSHGIIFIDEIDKLCNVKDEKSHVATTDVQEALLKLLDGNIIKKNNKKRITTRNYYI